MADADRVVTLECPNCDFSTWSFTEMQRHMLDETLERYMAKQFFPQILNEETRLGLYREMLAYLKKIQERQLAHAREQQLALERTEQQQQQGSNLSAEEETSRE